MVTQEDGVRADFVLLCMVCKINTLPHNFRMNTEQKYYVAGHRGMVGSAVIRRLHELNCRNTVTRSRSELDLTDQQAVNDFFASERPDVVVFAAAKVGGIHANSAYPAEFIYQNLAMSTHAVHAAYEHGVERFRTQTVQNAEP